jgi:hypothetical protein
MQCGQNENDLLELKWVVNIILCCKRSRMFNESSTEQELDKRECFVSGLSTFISTWKLYDR